MVVAILEILGVASEKRGFSNLSKSDQPVWDFIHFEKTRPRTLPHLMSLIWVFYQICFCHPSKPCPPIWGSRHFLNNEFSDPAKPYRPHLDVLTFSKTKFSDCFDSYQPRSDCVHFQKKGFRDLPNLVSPMWILLDVKKNIFLVPSKPHELDVDFVTFWQHGFSKVPKKSQPE